MSQGGSENGKVWRLLELHEEPPVAPYHALCVHLKTSILTIKLKK